MTSLGATVDSAAPGDGPARPPRAARVRRRAVVVLLVLAAGLGVAAGVAVIDAPSSTVTGKVVAFGSGGGECYPTVSYEVGGETYRFTVEKDDRWCALEWGGPAKVYFDTDHPGDGRLSRFDGRPWQLGGGALALLVLAVLIEAHGRGGTRRAIAWLLLAGWAATIVGALTTASRTGDVDHLVSAVSRGDVTEVEATGGLGPRGTGFATIELRWREHGFRYSTEVVQVRGRHAARHAGGIGNATSRFTGSLEDYLTIDGGTVRVARFGGTDSGFSATFLGWEIGGALALATVSLLALTLLDCGFGPEPWRATRWAWTWLMLGFAPLAAPAYLLLGGPTGLFRPLDPNRRLTGGWAFVIALLCGGIGNRA